MLGKCGQELGGSLPQSTSHRAEDLPQAENFQALISLAPKAKVKYLKRQAEKTRGSTATPHFHKGGVSFKEEEDTILFSSGAGVQKFCPLE